MTDKDVFYGKFFITFTLGTFQHFFSQTLFVSFKITLPITPYIKNIWALITVTPSNFFKQTESDSLPGTKTEDRHHN